jgi:hypothetical protein
LDQEERRKERRRKKKRGGVSVLIYVGVGSLHGRPKIMLYIYLSVALRAKLAVSLEGAIENKVPAGLEDLTGPTDDACGNCPRCDMENIGSDHQIVSSRGNSGVRNGMPVLLLCGIEFEGGLDTVVVREIGGVSVDA